jgi:hypothetical protein
MSNVLQGMFDILISCSIEFNTNIGFSELFIASTEPEMVTFTTPNSKTTSLRARFSTTQFSLVMHGFKDQINFCIVPVEELIGMTSFAYGRSAFIHLTARIEEDGVVWYLGEEMISEEVAERLCLEAMQRLVEQTCDVLQNTIPQ